MRKALFVIGWTVLTGFGFHFFIRTAWILREQAGNEWLAAWIPLVGLIVGLPQALLLRRYVSWAWDWLAAQALALPTSLVIASAAYWLTLWFQSLAHLRLPDRLNTAIWGLAVGLVYARITHAWLPERLPPRNRWLAANLLGWTLGLSLAALPPTLWLLYGSPRPLPNPWDVNFYFLRWFVVGLGVVVGASGLCHLPGKGE